MIFENYAVQHREILSDSTQFEPILLPKLSYNSISKTREDNKRLPSGQMVVNNEGKIVSLNQKLILIWKLPQHVVEARCERQVFQFISEQLKKPQSFLRDVRNVREQMELEIQNLVERKDGITFSHLIKPQWLDKKVVGRIYRFQLKTTKNKRFQKIR